MEINCIEYAGHKFCNNLKHYSRFKTLEVKIGTLALGSNNPIRIQSMTTTNTMDTTATVEQSIRMLDAGCELVRITAPSKNDAENLANIKKILRNKGYNTPLVADIHFTPNAAEIAATIVEKIRINPGNYADKKKFEAINYSEYSYNEELNRIRDKFIPLIQICKKHHTALRIGTNHGSLSDRIMSFYGDTPLGMVESAMEFLRICETENFHDIVLSMKASNTRVMVQAYRLLNAKMIKEGMNYPLHLGVTEAGDGEDGRIKSAVGIGTLLEDGLGDTIRVSLTEDPELEIPVAKTLANRYINRGEIKLTSYLSDEAINLVYNPFEYQRYQTKTVINIGGKNVPRVITTLSDNKTIIRSDLKDFGYSYNTATDKWQIADQACDYLFCGNAILDFETPGTLGLIVNAKTWVENSDKKNTYPIFIGQSIFSASKKHPDLNFVEVLRDDLSIDFIAKLKTLDSVVLIAKTGEECAMADLRLFFLELKFNNLSTPVIIQRNYFDLTNDSFQLFSATDTGGLLIDGFGDGIWINQNDCLDKSFINRTAFGILQATRTRISKTEYISCPSCGRTLFDLQETTQKIRSKTGHLKGIKIGIMGCIVNGPGEMADADYGYVGTGVGKIALYKGKTLVKKNISSENAVDELIALIKENGDWVE